MDDKHIIDLRALEAPSRALPPIEEGDLDFTPDQTPEAARMWLAQQRFDRDVIMHPKTIRPVTHG